MLRASHAIYLAVIALLGTALIMVHSARMQVGSGPGFDLVAAAQDRYVIHALVALLALVVASRIDVRQFDRCRGWSNPLWWLFVLAVGLVVLAMVPGVGRSVHGARRWLTVGPASWGVSFQPSEVVKWIMVVAIAWWCARRRDEMRRFWKGSVPALLLASGAAALIAVEDLGTGLLVAMVAWTLVLAGGARLWHLACLVPPAAAAVALGVIAFPYRMNRLIAFANPWQDPAGIGYHPIQSMRAIADGGLLGRGLGNGVAKLGYLPEDTTDFLFAVICEEMGVFGAALVVGLLLVLIWAGYAVIRSAADPFSRLFALGVVLTVGYQALINIAVVTVVVPTKGIALPLISAGGTGWIMTAAALGLLAALDRARRLETEPQVGCVAKDGV
ncbi:MAG: stage V sporulation protein E [Phycisphaeraceae bacterium]|nr:stage V sporulation protein E [Phycisphaeraceae bacterium]